MGPSGSGKTTLLNCLSGLDDIDAGRVLVGGRDLFAMSDAERTEHRARSHGLRVPVLQPHPGVHRRRRTSSCRCCSSARTAEEARRAGAGDARPGRPGRPGPAPAQRAVRRRAAARHDRPGTGRPSPRSSGPTSRPATSTPRWRPGDGSAAAAERRRGPDHRAGHPRPVDRRRGRTGWSGCATGCSTPTSRVGPAVAASRAFQEAGRVPGADPAARGC